MTRIISHEYSDLLMRLHSHFTEHGKVTLQGQLLKVQEELGEVAEELLLLPNEELSHITWRVIELQRSVGKAAEAYIGSTGANPRKGITHSTDDLAMELADVVTTAMLAIAFCGRSPNAVLVEQAGKTTQRLDAFDKERDLDAT